MFIMPRMNRENFDLNLLPVFDAVMATGNVSRVAERTGLSQPAVGHALARLRLTLKDPLFMPAPGGVRPIARAEHFARFVGAALCTLGVALQERNRVDPASTDLAVIIPQRPVQSCAAASPGIRSTPHGRPGTPAAKVGSTEKP